MIVKRIFIFICLTLLYLTSFSQKIPNSIPFQGIAKDYNGNPVNERKIYIQTNLIAGNIAGTTIYTEEHETTTDALGVFSVMIGQGRRTQGIIQSLSEINWEEGPFFLGIQLAITPNAPVQNWQYQNNWVNMGTTSLGIVPYAFYAVKTSGLSAKLNASDTAQMLRNYVDKQVVKLLDSAIASKLSLKDTTAMLASYIKSNSISSTNSTINNTAPIVNNMVVNNLNADYDSLKNKPVLFSGLYDSLKNKPILFSGAYTDLTGKPILFDGDYNSLSNKPVLNLNGDITNNGNITTLANSGVASGTYGNGLEIPILSIDEKGRITSASSSTITPNSFPNKTNTQKNAMSNISTGTVIWCSDCGTRGQMQVYNGFEWTDLTGAPALSNDISFGAMSTSNISSSSASITTIINTDGGNAITARGIVWSTSINPTIALSTKTSSGTGTGTFSASLTGLSASTVYYVRTYATHANGTVYGNEISFTTIGIIPSLTTTTASSININGFTTGGTVSDDGGNLVTYRGICWSTSANPTINDNRILSGTGTGTFTITLSNLNVATTYYVRAFATNSAGTAYGTQQTISTSGLVAGTSYLGGKIAYIFQSGDAGYVAGETHGFIIMNHKMGMTAAFGGYNSSSGTYTYANTSPSFGSGLNNTRTLNTKGWSNFANYVYGVSYDGYNDWYIPSYAEWNKIIPVWTNIGIGTGNFQSSSETDLYNNFYVSAYISSNVVIANMTNGGKSSTRDIIGIRNF